MGFAEVRVALAALSLGLYRTFQTIRKIGALPFLIAIYDRRIKAVSDLSQHLRFTISNWAADLTTLYFAKLFELRLQRYIEGVGHPHQVCFLEVDDNDFERDRYDPLLRANLILAAGSGSDMCPLTLGGYRSMRHDQGKIGGRLIPEILRISLQGCDNAMGAIEHAQQIPGEFVFRSHFKNEVAEAGECQEANN